MRLIFDLCAAVVMAALAATPSFAGKCPADAKKASFAIWPSHSLRKDQRVRAKHPCGRTLVCVSGNSRQNRPRICKWK